MANEALTSNSLVDRLYKADRYSTTVHYECHRLHYLAAREIERLRAALESDLSAFRAIRQQAQQIDGRNIAARRILSLVAGALAGRADETLAHRDPTGTTREPPHCPSCSCGLEPLPNESAP